EQKMMQHRVRDRPQAHRPFRASRKGAPALDEHPVLANHLPRPEVRNGGVIMRIKDTKLAASHYVRIPRQLALLEQELAVGKRARFHKRREETQVLAGDDAKHLAGA